MRGYIKYDQLDIDRVIREDLQDQLDYAREENPSDPDEQRLIQALEIVVEYYSVPNKEDDQ